MATLRKWRARKPLAESKVELSYGMRSEINDGRHGLQLTLYGDNDAIYVLHLTNDELDRAVKFRDASKGEFDEQDRRYSGTFNSTFRPSLRPTFGPSVDTACTKSTAIRLRVPLALIAKAK